jgi:DNA-directed RNA polymerase subunit RPC12/RpoP
VNVVFACPECDSPNRASLDQAHDWQCPACDHRLHFEKADPALPECAVCGCGDLYKQKDFPHRLGMFVLIGSFALSAYTYLVYEKWLTWAILIGSAAFDGLLYLWVGDALVCYRCGAHHRGFPKGSPKLPFELTVGERYRQERIRRERLKAQTSPK